MSRPEEVEAPNGVWTVEHRLDGESRVRAETGASHTVETPTDDSGAAVEVQVGAGALWVSVPPGGVEVQVNHGGFGALVSSGAVMLDAGEGSDGLLVVTAGEALLVDAAGTSRILTAGEAAVLGADGDLAGVDQVGEDELVGDPWVVANRALDDEVVVPEVEEEEPEPADEESAEPEAEAEPEPTDELVEDDDLVDEDDVAEVLDEEPDRDIDEAAAIVGGAEVVDQVVEGELVEPGDGPWLPPPEEPETAGGELLDELYAPPEVEAHEVSGRSIARVLEVAALVVFIAVAALLVFLFNQDDDGGGGTTEIANPVTTNRSTTTEDGTTTELTRSSTTAPAVPVMVDVITCTQDGEALVASGTVEGAPPTADGYRITVVVRLGDRTFGKKTITVERGDNENGRRSWKAEIPLNGDAVGAGAECEVPDPGGVSLV